MRKSELFFNVLRLPMDFVMLLAAGVATYLLRTEFISAFRPVLFEFNLPLIHFFYIVLAVSVLFIGLFAISGLYSMKARMGWWEENARVIIACSAGILSIIVFIFLRQELFNSRFLVLGGWMSAIVFVSLGRLIIRSVQRVAVGRYDFGVHRIVLIGDKAMAEQIQKGIALNPASGFRVIKHLQTINLAELHPIYQNETFDEIVVASSHFPSEQILELVDFCHDRHLVFKFVPHLSETLSARYGVDVISGMPVIELKRTPLEGWGKVFKRSLDIVGAIGGLIVSSPLFLLLPIIIRVDSDGPIFARLKRTSRNKEFNLLKFRSMVKDAELLKSTLTQFNERIDGPLFKIKNDPRVTKIGHFIRRHRIDELPQLWNVLKGDMSLVGPRPHQPDEIERYEKHHKKVLAIQAGATGLAQISGSSDLPFEQEVAYDSFYIENWSLFLDLKIIFKTLFRFFRDPSAV